MKMAHGVGEKTVRVRATHMLGACVEKFTRGLTNRLFEPDGGDSEDLRCFTECGGFVR